MGERMERRGLEGGGSAGNITEEREGSRANLPGLIPSSCPSLDDERCRASDCSLSLVDADDGRSRGGATPTLPPFAPLILTGGRVLRGGRARSEGEERPAGEEMEDDLERGEGGTAAGASSGVRGMGTGSADRRCWLEEGRSDFSSEGEEAAAGEEGLVTGTTPCLLV